MSTNLSKQRREKMIDTIKKIKNLVSEQPELLMELSEIENELKRKKYGLVWEDHEENVDVQMKTKIPVFVENNERKIIIDEEKPMNFILEGDNLHSLYLLEKTHKNNIDIIYIDPPYNRGKNDFRYDDAYLGEDDEFKHSKWLSFMDKRLRIAKRILSYDGVIFISIDDNEQASLKLLCDEIFGEENAIGPIIQNKLNAQNDANNIQKNHEYILVYRKTKKILNNKEVSTLYSESFKIREIHSDELGYYYKNGGITTGGEGGTLNKRKNLGYTIYYNPLTGDKLGVMDYDLEKALISNIEKEVYNDDIKLLNSGYIKIRPPKKDNLLGAWTWNIEKFNLEKDKILITNNKGKYSVIKKEYVDSDEIYEENGKKYYKSYSRKGNSKSIIEFGTGAGSTSLKNVLGENKAFNNPKNLEMIKYLLNLFPNNESRVLDFFAGSGTTGQAVLELNMQDKGNRKFILCTDNQNNICTDVTYRRISNVIKGYKNKKGINANLKYYTTEYIDRFNNENEDYYITAELSKHIIELVQLEKWIDSKDESVQICFSDDEIDEFIGQIKLLEKCQFLYISRNAMLTTNQEILLEKYDISIEYIPEYYFEKEIMEVEEW